MNFWNPGDSILKVICGVIILIAFVLMAVDLLIVYLKFFLMNVIVFFALALGGLNHFKQIGLNPVMTAIKVGVELFMIQGLMALSIIIIEKTWGKSYPDAFKGRLGRNNKVLYFSTLS